MSNGSPRCDEDLEKDGSGWLWTDQALKYQSVLELMETIAEHMLLRFPDADFWGKAHFEHSSSDGVPEPTS